MLSRISQKSWYKYNEDRSNWKKSTIIEGLSTVRNLFKVLKDNLRNCDQGLSYFEIGSGSCRFMDALADDEGGKGEENNEEHEDNNVISVN